MHYHHKKTDKQATMSSADIIDIDYTINSGIIEEMPLSCKFGDQLSFVTRNDTSTLVVEKSVFENGVKKWTTMHVPLPEGVVARFCRFFEYEGELFIAVLATDMNTMCIYEFRTLACFAYCTIGGALPVDALVTKIELETDNRMHISYMLGETIYSTVRVPYIQ